MIRATMPRPPRPSSFLLLALAFAAPLAHAAQRPDACDLPPPPGTGYTAAAIVRTACLEHKAWFQPFIDVDGRLASLTATEAERTRLRDDTPAWQRVARYWRESGTLSSMIHIPGARSCLYPAAGREADNDCRAYLIDNPWSAAFVSWVMARTPVPGFTGSARHMDYIARTWRDPEGGPYVHVDPFAEKAAPGDLLCYLRDADQALGPEGFRQALAGGRRAMPQRSHCDIVVAADVDGDRTLYLIGGNVFDAVTMRMLPLDADGRLLTREVSPPADTSLSIPGESAPEPTSGTGKPAKSRKAARAGKAAKAGRAGKRAAPSAPQAAGHAPAAATTSPADPDMPPASADCRPGNPVACSFNRRDWVVLLKLKPQEHLGGFFPVPATTEESPPPADPVPPPPVP